MNTAEGLKQVEKKLKDLQDQLAGMAERGESAAYMLGWAEGGIQATLIEINVWKEP